MENKSFLEQLQAMKKPRPSKPKPEPIHTAVALPVNAVADQFTDMRVAAIFAETFHNRLRYCPDLGKWLVYDSRRWVTDSPGGPYPFVRELITMLYGRVMQSGDRAEAMKAVGKLEAHPRQETIIRAAQTLPSLIVSADDLDQDAMLLNCLGETINLTTGDARPSDPGDLITRLVQVEYDRAATCKTFEKFLFEIMGGKQELVDYLQRFIGYCLTGKTHEQVFLFMWGVGCNGKSTLLTVIESILGDLSFTAGADLLMTREKGAATNDMAALRGARLVKISEFNESVRLDAARLKTLTGGDRITCRFLYQEPFEYTPNYKIIMAGNSKPRISETDHGTWRRVHMMPFRVIVPEDAKDPLLPEKLNTELPGILAWAVRGCLEWQRVGLQPPEEVTAAVAEYRAGEDTFHSWLAECCDQGPELSDTSRNLMDSFTAHTGNRFMTATKFGKLLSECGFRKERKFAGIAWAGLSLISDYE